MVVVLPVEVQVVDRMVVVVILGLELSQVEAID
jgi:hypothetical protein